MDDEKTIYMWQDYKGIKTLIYVASSYKSASEYIMGAIGRLIEPDKIERWVNYDCAAAGKIYITDYLKWRSDDEIYLQEMQIIPKYTMKNLKFEIQYNTKNL